MSQSLQTNHITQGEVIALFAFDVGYEIDLKQVGQLLSAQPIQPLSGTKQTPAHLQYTQPPQIISLGQNTALANLPGEIQATIYDFGAISIAYRWPLTVNQQPIPLNQLPSLSKTLFECELESDAKKQVEALVQKIHAAITRPALSHLVEDYYVFALQKLDEVLTAQELQQRYHATLAQTLRFETEQLSAEQQKEALAKAISYYHTDLALIDWNAAILYDPDYTDTLRVLELLNIELLEARYLDAELDKRIQVYEDVVQKQVYWPLPFLNPHRQTTQELAELRIESTLLAERVDNALKLIGDLYLARIHAAASDRFYIATWDASIFRKLDIIDNLYQLLTDRMNNTQTQMLEVIIIILIFLEIFLR
jgi:hypothetical protein